MSYVLIKNEHVYDETSFTSSLDGKKIIGWQNGIAIGPNKKLGSTKYFRGRNGDINIVGTNDDESVQITKQVHIIQELVTTEPEISYFFFDKPTNTITGYDPNGPKDVVIPNTIDGALVLHIGDEAFVNSQITTVSLPNYLISIGASAFRSNLLESLVLPDTVEIVGDLAFSDNELNNITFSNSLRVISDGAFSINNLEHINLPPLLETIGASAFHNNQIASVSGLIDDGSLRHIGALAFAVNQLTQDIVPKGVISVGDFAFRYNHLTSLVLCETVTSWGDGVYSDNEIISISIPVSAEDGESVISSIPSRMFENNFITELFLPVGVFECDEYAFGGPITQLHFGSDIRPVNSFDRCFGDYTGSLLSDHYDIMLGYIPHGSYVYNSNDETWTKTA